MSAVDLRARDQARFWAKVDLSDIEGCWYWIGSGRGGGYGSFRLRSGSVSPHRYVYEYMFGPIPEGLHIDHLCGVRNCVNPVHLEAVTPRENVLRGDGLSAQYAKRDHCIHGHPFDEENTGYWRGSRVCRTCKREHTRRHYLRKKAASQ